MAEISNDGALQHSTRILTIGSAAGGTGGTAYYCESFTPDRPPVVIEATDHRGEPDKQAILPGFVTASAVVHLNSATDRGPQPGWETTTTDTLPQAGSPAADVNEVWIVAGVSVPEQAGAEKKVNLTLRKKYNVS